MSVLAGEAAFEQSIVRPLGLNVVEMSAISFDRLCQQVREMRTKRYVAFSHVNKAARHFWHSVAGLPHANTVDLRSDRCLVVISY